MGSQTGGIKRALANYRGYLDISSRFSNPCPRGLCYGVEITDHASGSIFGCTIGCCCDYLEKTKCQVLKGVTLGVNTGVSILYICFIIFIEPLLFSSYIIKRSNSTTTR